MELGPQGEWVSMSAGKASWDSLWNQWAEGHTRMSLLGRMEVCEQRESWIFSLNLLPQHTLPPSPPSLSPLSRQPPPGCSATGSRMGPTSENWCRLQTTWTVGPRSAPEETKDWWKYFQGDWLILFIFLPLKDMRGASWCLIMIIISIVLSWFHGLLEGWQDTSALPHGYCWLSSWLWCFEYLPCVRLCSAPPKPPPMCQTVLSPWGLWTWVYLFLWLDFFFPKHGSYGIFTAEFFHFSPCLQFFNNALFQESTW